MIKIAIPKAKTGGVQHYVIINIGQGKKYFSKVVTEDELIERKAKVALKITDMQEDIIDIDKIINEQVV